MSSSSTTAQFHRWLAAFGATVALCPCALAAGQAEIGRITDALVAEALEASLGLDQAEAQVDERLAILDQARAAYLPSIDLQLRFSEADGGREIEVPALDLRFRFLREREQESFVRLTQPIYDARIGAERRGAAHVHAAARHGLEAYRLRLARDVRVAYYRWLAARESIGVLQATATLAAENARVNESLWRNGKVTRDLRLRAEADHLEIEQQLLRAHATEDMARRYLNLLCNAPLAREPAVATVTDADLPRLAHRIPAWGGALEESAVERRSELRELDAGLAAAGEAERAARAAFRPQLAFAVDAGTQGEDWNYADQDPYVLASFIVRFNLFNGGGDRAAIRAARAQSRELAAGRGLAENQIRIEVQEAISDLEVAEASSATAARRIEAAQAAYTIVARKRDLGQVSPADYLDAQRALTEARLNGNVTRFEMLAALAEVEYAIGGTEKQP